MTCIPRKHSPCSWHGRNGEATQKQVIDSIVADIGNCTSQQEALNMAAQAFGTMAEDGNLKFITSLTSVGETYDSVAGSAENLFSQTQTPMQEMEANTRKLQQALIPLGEKIVELANVVLPPSGGHHHGSERGVRHAAGARCRILW